MPHDFNVRRENKRVENLRYLHRNPAKRGFKTPMKTTVIAFPLLLLLLGLPRRIDQVCQNGLCDVLEVRSGVVHYRDSTRDLVLGPYTEAGSAIVPDAEAPMHIFRYRSGWKTVLSAALEHKRPNQGLPQLRIRFFDPRGALQLTENSQVRLIYTRYGALFGGDDEILAITTEWEHSYSDQTEIWLLPASGTPKSLLSINGAIEEVRNGSSGKTPGVAIAKQTYDGEHAETKGIVDQEYYWDPISKTLTLRPK